ncbi:MAG: DUF2259 domain-containing protein [Treponema sp.]|nr:DUF2259 domain-containing protein [Treponema sp.]
MKKIVFGMLFFIAVIFSAFTGDAAVFKDIGFSSDGRVYMFGEYGKTDKTFCGWAVIYTVDVVKNDFVKGEVYKTNPTSATNGKSGREVYDALVAKNYAVTKKYNCVETVPEHVLYICSDETKRGTDQIVFKDFAGTLGSAATYCIDLVPTVSGNGKNARSSFYIMLEKRDEHGSVVSRQKIGSPDIVRKGVTDYRIEKIFCDRLGTSLIFVISKTMEDDTGVLIRYMVEAARVER